MKLVIVESPTKATTISKFLGKGYQVESSYGHVRDLPKSSLGIDVEHDFEPHYVVPRKMSARVTALKKAAAKSDGVILATDEDREGEAIAWHLTEALGITHPKSETPPSKAGPPREENTKSVQRIVFHEITKSAINEALASPREIDLHLVDAQQARRVLDRLVGYKLSPFLWKKITRGLSAGRVQSVALRLIADREEEIKSFKPQEYWTIAVKLKNSEGEFEAALLKVNGETIPELGITAKADALRIAEDLEKAAFTVAHVEDKAIKKNPPPPFITSTLQQAAAQRLGFSSKKTMFLAQALYEHGHITYMRTDSVNLSSEALTGARVWITHNLDAPYAVGDARVFKNKSRLAQEAHEAIRPTVPGNAPLAFGGSLRLDRDHERLYELIWRRFIASQLPSALFDATHVEISATSALHQKPYTLTANGTVLKFDGFLKILPMKFEEHELPIITDGESLERIAVTPEEHHTEPPPRYNEASLVKTLEKYGIGRPSTYAPTISVIQTRNYVEKRQGRFYPTEIGSLVNSVLKEHFPEIVDIDFTANMEGALDRIAEGGKEWQTVIRDFYGPFAEHLLKKYASVSKEKIVAETTNEICEKCGKPMIIKFGRFGKFMACSGFPDCKNTRPIAKEPPKPTGITCPKCMESPERKDAPGELVERRVARPGRARGKIFWGCNKYPACDFAMWTKPELDGNGKLIIPEPAPKKERKPRKVQEKTPRENLEAATKENSGQKEAGGA